jgi:glycerate 2-kinase
MTERGHAKRVVLAPDKFKGSLTAAEVAEALTAGLLDVLPGLETIKLPVADGGDGTVAAALSAGLHKIMVETVGPTGEPVQAPYAQSGDRAVVELAAVVGLSMLPGGRLEPLASSTYGLGLVIADAIRRGATTIMLGLGGSASTDGGAGMVQALRARLLDADGQDLALGGGALADLQARRCVRQGADVQAVRGTKRSRGSLVRSCRVDNELDQVVVALVVHSGAVGGKANDFLRRRACPDRSKALLHDRVAFSVGPTSRELQICRRCWGTPSGLLCPLPGRYRPR